MTPDGGPPADGTVTEDGTVLPDQSPDAGPAAKSIFFKKCIVGAVTQTSSTSLGTIRCADGDLSVKVNANGTDKYLFMPIGHAHVLHTAGAAGQSFPGFQLHVDGVAEVAGTVSAHGNSKLQPCQHLPMTLFGVRDLSAGKHNLSMEWYTSGSPWANGKLSVRIAKLLALSR